MTKKTKFHSASLDDLVMAKLRAPFGCEFIKGMPRRNVFGDAPPVARWRIHDANDDAIASVNEHEEGYARLIVQALNEHFDRRQNDNVAVMKEKVQQQAAYEQSMMEFIGSKGKRR